MKHSDALDKIIPALVKAQSEMAVVPKIASNPHYKSLYQTFDMVMAAIKPHLAPNGLALTFGMEDGTQHGADVTTTVWHVSGQWISEAVWLPFDKLTPQGGISALTYGSRRGASAMFAIVADDDDDGNESSGIKVDGKQQAPAPARAASAKPNGQPPKARSAVPSCPTCGGEMYDNRAKKASGEFKPKSPDFTCKDKECKNEKGYRSGAWVKDDEAVTAMAAPHNVPNHGAGFDHDPDFGPDDDPLPF